MVIAAVSVHLVLPVKKLQLENRQLRVGLIIQRTRHGPVIFLQVFPTLSNLSMLTAREPPWSIQIGHAGCIS